ncbi:MAG: PQQ-binding-like beta-propeller repeat protein [Mycolicibacterium hassiacum]
MLIGGAVLAAVVVIDLIRRRAGAWTTLWSVLVGIPAAVMCWYMSRRVEQVLAVAPATGRAPAVLAAGIAVLMAAVIAFATGWVATTEGLLRVRRWLADGLARRWLAAGMAAGVAIAGVPAVGLARVSDDARWVDATTAPAVAVPAVPVSLGGLRFTIDGSPERPDEFAPPDWVVAAGAGFVVRDAKGVRAYDSNGQQRWHYLRTGPANVHFLGMGVYDGGRTVVLEYGGNSAVAQRFVALDALTGEILWQKDDVDEKYSLRAPPGIDEPSPYMIVADTAAWVRIDTRTGNRLWRIDLPDGCATRGAVTATRVLSVAACADGDGDDEARIMVASFDAATGERVFDKEVGRLRRPEDGGFSWLTTIVRPGNDDLVAFSAGTEWQGVNVVTGDVVPIGSGPLSYLGDPGTELLTRMPYPEKGLEMRSGPDAAVRCRIAGEHRSDRPVAWLGEQVVTVRNGIAAYARSDCTPGARYEDESGRVGVRLAVPAPGVLLAVRVLGDKTYIDGYA